MSTATKNKRGARGPNLKKREQTRIKLLNSALTLLKKKTAADITINEITTQARVALGTFYNYFEDKSHIINATAEWICSDLFESVTSTLDEADTTGRIRLESGLRLVSLSLLAPKEYGFLLFERELPLDHFTFRVEQFIADNIPLEQGVNSLKLSIYGGAAANVLTKEYKQTLPIHSTDLLVSQLILGESKN